MKSIVNVSIFLAVAARAEELLVFSSGVSDYQLASPTLAPEIWVASNDHPGVERTAKDLANDFGRVTGENGTVHVEDELNGTSFPLIIAGTIGESDLIDKLISNEKIDVSSVEGQWEAYISVLVEDPAPDIGWALVVAGSDHRGTMYGLCDISETIGVSPWYWWADVAVKTKSGIWVRDTQKVQSSPSIKYRGFFINDEAPGLSSWTTNNFGTPSFNSEFYAYVFELLLRLKANYLWPAMWGSGFYVDNNKSGHLADEYGIIMGTSHHEPMARSEKEQKSEIEGPWDWNDNKDEITEFFRQGAERGAQWETIYTLGMRDSKIPN